MPDLIKRNGNWYGITDKFVHKCKNEKTGKTFALVIRFDGYDVQDIVDGEPVNTYHKLVTYSVKTIKGNYAGHVRGGIAYKWVSVKQPTENPYEALKLYNQRCGKTGSNKIELEFPAYKG